MIADATARGRSASTRLKRPHPLIITVLQDFMWLTNSDDLRLSTSRNPKEPLLLLYAHRLHLPIGQRPPQPLKWPKSELSQPNWRHD